MQTYFNFIILRLINYKHLTNSPSVVTECGVALWALVHNRANLQIRHLREHQKCQKAQKYKQIQTSMKFQLLDIWNQTANNFSRIGQEMVSEKHTQHELRKIFHPLILVLAPKADQQVNLHHR
jgi:hypothetical protein